MEQPDAHLTGRLFPLLAAHASNPAWLDQLERCAGRIAVRVPTGSGAHSRALGALARETGEVLSRVADALDDRRITPAEFADIDKDIDDVLRAAAALQQALLVAMRTRTSQEVA